MASTSETFSLGPAGTGIVRLRRQIRAGSHRHNRFSCSHWFQFFAFLWGSFFFVMEMRWRGPFDLRLCRPCSQFPSGPN
ncbi:hypothetical protein Dimus_017987, partial [Dionaea muscipula]